MAEKGISSLPNDACSFFRFATLKQFLCWEPRRGRDRAGSVAEAEVGLHTAYRSTAGDLSALVHGAYSHTQGGNPHQSRIIELQVVCLESPGRSGKA